MTIDELRADLPTPPDGWEPWKADSPEDPHRLITSMETEDAWHEIHAYPAGGHIPPSVWYSYSTKEYGADTDSDRTSQGNHGTPAQMLWSAVGNHAKADKRWIPRKPTHAGWWYRDGCPYEVRRRIDGTLCLAAFRIAVSDIKDWQGPVLPPLMEVDDEV